MVKYVRIALLLLMLFVPASTAHAQNQVPGLTGIVTDYTQMLSYADIQQIEQYQQQVILQSAGRLQHIYVLLTPDLYGFSDSNLFGQAVFDANGLGFGDVLITIEFDSHALVLTNSSELDVYLGQNSPNCSGDWGSYIVNDVMPGYLGNGDFVGGVTAGMQEVGNSVIQTPANCYVPPQQSEPFVANQPATPTETSRGITLWDVVKCLFWLFVLAVFLYLLFLIVKAIAKSDSTTVYVDTGPSYNWPSEPSQTYTPTYRPTYSPPSPSSSRSSNWAGGMGGQSSRSSFGTGASSSRSSFSTSSHSSPSHSTSRSGKW